jgi:DNA-binding NarL/FixJ family response regulator
MENQIRVIIVDDQKIFRKGILLLLIDMPDVKVVAEAANGQEFLELLKTNPVDLVLMDIKMPVMDGIEATKLAIQQNPELKVLVVSMYGEEEYLINMLEAGVKGFVLKTVEEEELQRAIRTIMQGKNYFSQELLGTIAKSFVNKTVDKKEEEDVISKLTPREIEVIKLISQGFTIREIAKKLDISSRTVDGHKTNIFAKTGTESSVQLVTFAIKHNLVKL